MHVSDTPSAAPAAPRWRQTAIVVLLAGILASQWILHSLAQREAARNRRVLESIQTLLQKEQQDNTEMLGALDDMQELLDDIHGHLAPDAQ
jgi:type II secretory pathway pseudopilin PulG